MHVVLLLVVVICWARARELDLSQRKCVVMQEGRRISIRSNTRRLCISELDGLDVHASEASNRTKLHCYKNAKAGASPRLPKPALSYRYLALAIANLCFWSPARPTTPQTHVMPLEKSRHKKPCMNIAIVVNCVVVLLSVSMIAPPHPS